MELQPEQSLTRLTQAMKDLRSPHKDRIETLKQLQGMVSRCEVEIANLSHKIEKNPELTRLYRQLILQTEMAKGDLPRS